MKTEHDENDEECGLYCTVMYTVARTRFYFISLSLISTKYSLLFSMGHTITQIMWKWKFAC